jgi:hypothetical protein
MVCGPEQNPDSGLFGSELEDISKPPCAASVKINKE